MAETGNTRPFLLALVGLLGFVGGFMVLLANIPVDQSLRDLSQDRGAWPDTRSGYDFHSVLTDSEGLEPIVESLPTATVIPPATRVVPGNAQNLSRRNVASEVYAEIPASAYGQESYYLQAGNYGNPDEAERMRAQLLLLGLEAFTVAREGPGGQVGYRVRVGPFVDPGRLVEAKKRLRRGGIAYDIVRVTG